MMGGGGLAGLIGNASVQKELKLDDKQVEKAKEYAASARRRWRKTARNFRGSRAKSAARRQQELTKEMNDAALKAFGEFLKPEQITRLKQISYQSARCTGLHRPRGRQETEHH